MSRVSKDGDIEIYNLLTDDFKKLTIEDVDCLEEIEQGYRRIISAIRGDFTKEEILNLHEFNLDRYKKVRMKQSLPLLTHEYENGIPVEFKNEKVQG